MQTVNDLCKCFDGFSDGSRIIIHLDHGETVIHKWEDGCSLCYTVKRFAVSNIINNLIFLEVWN